MLCFRPEPKQSAVSSEFPQVSKAFFLLLLSVKTCALRNPSSNASTFSHSINPFNGRNKLIPRTHRPAPSLRDRPRNDDEREEGPSSDLSRRLVLKTLPIAGAVLLAPPASAAPRPGLAARLASRDPSALSNPLFNLPPGEQIYPDFMRGSWKVALSFSGYTFPSKAIDRAELVADASVPGFQRCSVALLADVGRDGATYAMDVDARGRMDVAAALASSIDSHIGRAVVRGVDWDPKVTPNRAGVSFVTGSTRNAERIELFWNGRESEVAVGDDGGGDVFVCAEYLKQVTFGLSTQFGVARQVATNYAHFWTWKDPGDGKVMKGNLLTAAYIDPQDPLFFKETVRPVVVYSHDLVATRV
mmetsp:Transcript_19441/g.44283  ORF Transcript_19441/g.44283 Transcript_19441/m.44283 type:complete len:359 (-) Transcript_19441:58-1134(-)